MKIRTKKQELFEKISFFCFGLSRLQFKYKSVHKSQATRLIWFGTGKNGSDLSSKVC
jgi:hypothetical protein